MFDSTKRLIATAAPTTAVRVDKLQLGMVQKEASAGTLGTVTVSNTLTAVNGDYTISGNLNSKSTDIKNGGTLRVDGRMTATGDILVGSSDSVVGAGTLIAQNLTLGGNVLFADPAWITDGAHDGNFGSKVAVAEFTGTNKNVLDGDYYAGQASQISLGTRDTAILSNVLKKSKLWGTDIIAALYVHSPVALAANGAIHVNGAIETKPAVALNEARFAANSLLVVNAGSLSGTQAAISAANTSTTATIDSAAKLHLTNAKSGVEYTMLGGFDTGKITYATNGWQGVGNLL